MFRFFVLNVMTVLAFSIIVFHAAAGATEADKSYGTYLRLMRDKQYEQAWELLLSRKQAGDRWTVREYPDWFGRDVPPEVSALVNDWLNKEARRGNADAQVTLAIKYLQSEKPRERLAEAVGLLDTAADQGNQTALFYLGQMDPKALESLGITSKHAGKGLTKTR